MFPREEQKTQKRFVKAIAYKFPIEQKVLTQFDECGASVDTVAARNTDKEKLPLRQKILCHRRRFHYHEVLGVLRHSTMPDAALPRLSENTGKKRFALRALP